MCEYGLEIELRAITPIENEPTVVLSFMIRGNGKAQKRRLIISQQSARELALKKGKVDTDTFDLIEDESKRCGAYTRGLGILGYGANSERDLKRKLRQKGFDGESAEYAVQKLKKEGYIDETAQARRTAEACLDKLWGERRILAYLREKGYCDQAINAAREVLVEVDFAEACARLIKKKKITLPKNKKEASKVIASLQRYGYSLSQIYEAFEK